MTCIACSHPFHVGFCYYLVDENEQPTCLCSVSDNVQEQLAALSTRITALENLIIGDGK